MSGTEILITVLGGITSLLWGCRMLLFSKAGLKALRAMHERVMDTFHLSLNVFMSGEPDGACQLLACKTEWSRLELAGTEQHIERLRIGQVESTVTSAIHLDVPCDLQRINSHPTSVANPVLERAGELRPTRLKKKALRQVQDKPDESVRHQYLAI